MDIKRLISKSVDFKYFFNGLLYFGISDLFFGAIAIALAMSDISRKALMMASSFLLLFLTPITIYYIARIVILYSVGKDCQLYDATVKEVHNSGLSLWRSCYFTIDVVTSDGTIITMDTSGVFKHSELSSAYFGNYLNKTLKVLYNPKNELVAVVGIAEEK